MVVGDCWCLCSERVRVYVFAPGTAIGGPRWCNYCHRLHNVWWFLWRRHCWYPPVGRDDVFAHAAASSREVCRCASATACVRLRTVWSVQVPQPSGAECATLLRSHWEKNVHLWVRSYSVNQLSKSISCGARAGMLVVQHNYKHIMFVKTNKNIRCRSISASKVCNETLHTHSMNRFVVTVVNLKSIETPWIRIAQILLLNCTCDANAVKTHFLYTQYTSVYHYEHRGSINIALPPHICFRIRPQRTSPARTPKNAHVGWIGCVCDHSARVRIICARNGGIQLTGHGRRSALNAPKEIDRL